MKKRFNTTGLCIPDRHYMVDISNKIDSITKLIDDGELFTINRARQYGKTTTLHLLAQSLKKRYTVFALSFEGIGDKALEDEFAFCNNLVRLLEREIKFKKTLGVSEAIQKQMKQLVCNEKTDFTALTDFFLDLCYMCDYPVVLLIDEVDQASNHKTFLDFLGVLRNNFLQRSQMPSFQSVVLAGVYDIKNLKLKLRPEGEHQYNSPWNIASDFKLDMSFNIGEISQMLKEYEQDYHTNMNIIEISTLIFEYTSGYPYMVSRICKLLDEEINIMPQFSTLSDVWSREGVLEAVKNLLKEPNTLFDDMLKKINDYPQLKEMLYHILFLGESYMYNIDNIAVNLGVMFGFFIENNNTVTLANRIFETRIYNLFLLEESVNSKMAGIAMEEHNQFIINGHLDMDLIIRKFFEHFTEIYADSDDKFIEENGRRIFLIFLKPIINGTGNYYIEARTRDSKRTDVIVDYHGQQEIVELKIWHGQEYNKRGEQQLFEYLHFYNKNNGYLLSFNFNKNKVPGIREINYKGKRILEAVC